MTDKTYVLVTKSDLVTHKFRCVFSLSDRDIYLETNTNSSPLVGKRASHARKNPRITTVQSTVARVY